MPHRFAVGIALGICLLGASPPRVCAADSHDLFAPLRSALAATRLQLQRAPAGSLDEARLAARAGDFARARRAVGEVLKRDSLDLDASLLRCRLDLAEYRFPEFRGHLAPLAARHPEYSEIHRLQTRWDFLCDDLESAEARFQKILAADSTDPVGVYYSARFQHLTLNFAAAITGYQAALRHASTSEDSVRALEGLGACWLQKGDKDAALRYESQALALRGADDGLLASISDVLIKLGREAEGHEALELAIQINPCNEISQYLLGNGYARLNYSELMSRYPRAFAAGPELAALREADSLWNSGKRAESKEALARLSHVNPDLADVESHLGSYAYEEGDPAAAVSHFRRSLDLCPDYGRAHSGLARSLELYRRAVDIHHDRYEREFAAAEWPAIPGIEKFVVNYSTLTPRIQKRVCMSVAPWKSYVPVLVDGGATFYIKHLHELLSECPGQELLRDQRISYDLRLWDDVRGCGGYRTVTGLEDVEGTLLGRYNTVLHELSHQVHGVLSADLVREIQELYRGAKSRLGEGKEAFVSLYQASSVYEYLAEGVNSMFTPRRDRFDTRDILRERLEARDPALIAEIQKLMAIQDVSRFYPAAYTNAGDDRLQSGKATEAVEFYKKAMAGSDTSEEAPASLSYAYSVLGRGDEAVAAIRHAAELRPASARVQLQRIAAEYVRSGDRPAELAALRELEARVDPRERFQVWSALGGAALDEGQADEARRAADSLLAYQGDNPEGLLLRAQVESAMGRPDSAQVYFDMAERVRSGWLGLRAEHVSAILARPTHTPAELEEAARQLEAARLADPLEPRLAVLDGWIRLERGSADSASALLGKALKENDWLDLGRILKARADAVLGDRSGAQAELGRMEPRFSGAQKLRYIYNSRQGSYDLVGEVGRVEKQQFELARKVAGSKDPAHDGVRSLGKH